MKREGAAPPRTAHSTQKIAGDLGNQFSAAGTGSARDGTAYERIVDKLHDLDLRPRTSYSSTVALCPSHDDRQPSLAVYDKDGKAKVVCFAGCDDALDILPALEMTIADLYDEPRSSGTRREPNPSLLFRYEARKTMTPSQKATDDLLQLLDLGEHLCLAIARIRPELYIWEREQLGTEPAQLAHDAQHAHGRLGGVGANA